ncbi:MAG: hypothetical protein RIG61_04920 [Deltaproteobacteria bacterium]
MKNKIRLLSFLAVFVLLVSGGIFFATNQPAESQQPEVLSFTGMDLEQDMNFLTGFTSGPDIVVAKKSCGDETCSANQCCCLNIDTGAQCCRPKVEDNCIESCKKSEPC